MICRGFDGPGEEFILYRGEFSRDVLQYLRGRQLESAQNTGQLQTDIVAPGAFMVQIRRPATDEDQQQERPRNR